MITPEIPVIVTPLNRYYTSLDEGAFEDAAAAFALDAVCMRPARDGSGGLETIRGRDAILATFRRRSGQPIRHEPQTCAVDGRAVLIEGRVTRNGKVEGVFLASATVDRDGMITRYLALAATIDE